VEEPLTVRKMIHIKITYRNVIDATFFVRT
jgi:hypothetical protein